VKFKLKGHQTYLHIIKNRAHQARNVDIQV